MGCVNELHDSAFYQSLNGTSQSGHCGAKVIINADDLGFSKGINSAIFRFAESGAITSASLMAVGPDFEQAASWAARQKHISIGVHLCLTDGLKPLTEARGLIGKDGKFYRLGKLAMQAFCRSVPLDEIRLEWQAQIALIQSKGIKPTHLDSHQHVHILPGIADVVRELAKEEHLAVRHTSGPLAFDLSSCKGCSEYWKTLCRPGVWKSLGVRLLGRSLKRKLDEGGVPTIDAYISPSSLCGRMRNEVTEDSLLMITKLASATQGIVEWVVHPSEIDTYRDEPEWMSRMRHSESSLLKSNSHMNALQGNDISSATYSAVRSQFDGMQIEIVDVATRGQK